MKSNLSNRIARQAGVPLRFAEAFLSNFLDSILLAAEKGIAKTPLFRISKLENDSFKPSVNPSSRLRASISLMPLNNELVNLFSLSLGFDAEIVTRMLNALMDIGKQLLCTEGKFLIPNTVKLEAKTDGVIRIVSLKRLKQASARSELERTVKSSTVEDLSAAH